MPGAEEIVCKTSMYQKKLNVYLKAMKDFFIFGLNIVVHKFVEFYS